MSVYFSSLLPFINVDSCQHTGHHITHTADTESLNHPLTNNSKQWAENSDEICTNYRLLSINNTSTQNVIVILTRRQIIKMARDGLDDWVRLLAPPAPSNGYHELFHRLESHAGYSTHPIPRCLYLILPSHFAKKKNIHSVRAYNSLSFKLLKENTFSVLLSGLPTFQQQD
jgi:hypothetical protein